MIGIRNKFSIRNLIVGLCVHPYYLILASTPTILDAKNLGEHKARIIWDENGFNCNTMSAFQDLIHRVVFVQCQEMYADKPSYLPSSSYEYGQLLEKACQTGANNIYTDKQHSCHEAICLDSGRILGSVVTSIICQYLHPQWYATLLPRNCIDMAISSCITTAVPFIEEKIENNECSRIIAGTMNGNSSGLRSTIAKGSFYDNVQSFCRSLVQAYVS